jgi:hypothetical protein
VSINIIIAIFVSSIFFGCTVINHGAREGLWCWTSATVADTPAEGTRSHGLTMVVGLGAEPCVRRTTTTEGTGQHPEPRAEAPPQSQPQPVSQDGEQAGGGAAKHRDPPLGDTGGVANEDPLSSGAGDTIGGAVPPGSIGNAAGGSLPPTGLCGTTIKAVFLYEHVHLQGAGRNEHAYHWNRVSYLGHS